MGRWQPYLYNAPARNSIHDVPDTFNPRAVTMASREPPKTKPKKEGPLINFNQHPDSYLVLPYGNTNAKPMHPKTKTMVKVARWIQLFFRVLTLLGAIGALLCGIFIKGAQDTEGYIIRIPPGVDIVACLYGIYHLLRAAKSRPAGSSASYHFFALVMDAGFVPFYVFTVLLARRNYNQAAGTSGRWRTFFPTDEDTNAVLDAAWLIATATAGLHCASIVLDLYLVLIFRKISNLPPDLNPLEENLTSRRKSKHKHKTSSISAITPLTAEEKRFSAQSGRTTLVATITRSSQADPLIEKQDAEPKMAFMHTRNNSEMTYSPHTPASARQSRHSVYSQSASARQSRADLHTREDLLRRDDGSDNETLAQRKSLLAQQAIKRSSRPNSMISSKQSFYTPPSTAKTQEQTGDISLQSSRETLQSDNWFVHDEGEPETYSGSPKKSMFQSKTASQGYNAVPADGDVSDDEYDPPLMPQPLRMNPPTPPLVEPVAAPAKSTPPPSKLQRTTTVTSMSTDATFSAFSRSPTRSGTIKSRYYGDLKAATQGIRNGGSPANSPSASPTKNTFTPNSLPSVAKAYTTNSPSPTKNNPPKPSPNLLLDKKNFASVRRTGETGHTPTKAQSPRVISRSGVDYDGASKYALDDDYFDLASSGGRRRDVSGKIAEEGRGGAALGTRWAGGMGNEGGLTYRKVSGVA